MNIFIMICITIVAYIVGSLSPAVFLSKTFGGYDIRTKGSMSAGSSNVFRVMGAKLGIINFILDLLKGALPTLLGFYIATQLGIHKDIGGICVASGIVIGHAFPIFSKFRGGKCVASSAGILLVFNPIIIGIVIIVALSSIAITGYVSIASIVVFFIYPIVAWFLPEYTLAYQIFLSCLGALILFLHRSNIKRLLKGEENRLFTKKKKNEK